MARATLKLGYSPCPNDTFMFHALVHGLVTVPGTSFEPVLCDIEELNRRALSEDGATRLPLTKMSAATLALCADRYVALSSGAALGRGVGPLVVVRAGDRRRGLEDLAGARVAIPGRHTTANLLLSVLVPRAPTTVEMRFDLVMEAVASGVVDAGVVIHESRFTYTAHGLACLADLGVLWEQRSGLPLALGVIAADRGLPSELRRNLARGIADSVRHAFAQPSASRDYVRAHAQEMAEDVCARHIALYVNEFSVGLGDEGRRALRELVARARERGFAPLGPDPLGD